MKDVARLIADAMRKMELHDEIAGNDRLLDEAYELLNTALDIVTATNERRQP